MKAEISIEAVCDLKNRLTDEAEVNHLDQVLSLACAMLCELCDEIEIDPMRLSEYREKLFKDE
ncbi:MAG: hypothetical protein Q4A83_06675 [Bacillota bacterium]|nr:hypothetical protein [Bacillota bacterium]